MRWRRPANNDMAIRVLGRWRSKPKATLTTDVVTLLRICSSSPALSTQFEREKKNGEKSRVAKGPISLRDWLPPGSDPTSCFKNTGRCNGWQASFPTRRTYDRYNTLDGASAIWFAKIRRISQNRPRTCRKRCSRTLRTAPGHGRNRPRSRRIAGPGGHRRGGRYREKTCSTLPRSTCWPNATACRSDQPRSTTNRSAKTLARTRLYMLNFGSPNSSLYMSL